MHLWKLALFALALATAARAEAPIAIGDRLEPFLDLHLVDTMRGTTHEFQEPQEITSPDQPPSDGYYATVIYLPDQKKYLLYSREVVPGYVGTDADGNAGEVIVLEESTDGVHWTQPKLGLFEVNGSKDNNYIIYGMPPFTHNFSPFLDANPACPAEQRFKALAGVGTSGLVAFVSPDGVHWKKLRDEAVIPTVPGAMMFDSQNVAFWSPLEKQYVAYCRRTTDVRRIVRTTSPDFLTWTTPELVPANLPNEHLYTSQAHPYYRAPHIVIGLATRFSANASTDISLLSTRNGTTFDRALKEAFIRPAPLRESWSNRGNYAALNVFPLAATTRRGKPDDQRAKAVSEMGILVRDRVYKLRVDGFASIHAGYEPGEMVTKPLVFAGDELVLNYRTSAGGSVGVEILDAAGKPIAGFSRADMEKPLRGDAIDQAVSWKGDKKLSSLAGKPVRLRFTMREADLFAIQFRKKP